MHLFDIMTLDSYTHSHLIVASSVKLPFPALRRQQDNISSTMTAQSQGHEEQTAEEVDRAFTPSSEALGDRVRSDPKQCAFEEKKNSSSAPREEETECDERLAASGQQHIGRFRDTAKKCHPTNELQKECRKCVIRYVCAHYISGFPFILLFCSKFLRDCMWATYCWASANYDRYQRLAMNHSFPHSEVLLEAVHERVKELGEVSKPAAQCHHVAELKKHSNGQG